jgi:hypothetical protein
MGPPPGVRVAMLAPPTRSRCPVSPQYGQCNVRPEGLGTRRLQDGQVEDVPRSSTRTAVMPACSALSCRVRRRWPIRQSLTRLLCLRPAARSRTPQGSPIFRVPTRRATDQAITSAAASWCPGDPPVVGGFLLALPGAGLLPPPRPLLAQLGRPPPRRLRPPFRIGQVQVGLRADRPARDQQALARQRRPAGLPPPPGQVQRARPHITRRYEQTEAPPPLRRGNPQPDPGGPVHHRRAFVRTRARHVATTPAGSDRSETR